MIMIQCSALEEWHKLFIKKRRLMLVISDDYSVQFLTVYGASLTNTKKYIEN